MQARAPRILIADDDDALRCLLAATLRRDGYEAVEAADGSEALEYVEACHRHKVLEPPDLVIADIRMPRFTGLQLLASMRARLNVERLVPVILITAFGDLETHAHASRLGALAVLDKPFDLDVLRALAKQVVPVDKPALDGTSSLRRHEIVNIVRDLEKQLELIGLELELLKRMPPE